MTCDDHPARRSPSYWSSWSAAPAGCVKIPWQKWLKQPDLGVALDLNGPWIEVGVRGTRPAGITLKALCGGLSIQARWSRGFLITAERCSPSNANQS